ncbi:hypothetical protein CLOM_g15931, partial [Closterium sp. NIES-68]
LNFSISQFCLVYQSACFYQTKYRRQIYIYFKTHGCLSNTKCQTSCKQPMANLTALYHCKLLSVFMLINSS